MTDDEPAGRLRRWAVVESSWAFRSSFLGLRRDRCRLPDGRLSPDFYWMELRDVCLTVALTPDRQILLSREYKHGAGDVMFTLPAGFIEHGEAPATAARREVLEETGYAAERFEPLGSFLLLASLSPAQAHVFLAADATPTAAPNPDEYEEIEVRAISLDEARRDLDRPRPRYFTDVASALGLHRALRRIDGDAGPAPAPHREGSRP